MNIERIKSVKLLRTLKGTDDSGVPVYWLAGETFYPDKKSLPQSILRELTVKRMGGSILEVELKPESPPSISEPKEELSPVKVVEETFDIPLDDIKEEIPEEIPEEEVPTKVSIRRRKK